jgi:hypothetical protein
MDTTFPPRPIPLRQPFVWRQLDAVMHRLQPLAHRIRAWHDQRADYRRSAQAERDLSRLSLRTLQDIGAPEGLIGQRRWQDEHEAIRQTYWLNMRC